MASRRLLMHMKLRLALLAAPLLLVLASACGGDDDDDKKAPSILEGEDVAKGLLLTPAPAEATPGFTVADVVPGTGGATYPDAAGALSALLNQGLAAPFVVAYKTSGSDGTAGDAYSVANRPPLSRIDVTNAGDTQPASLTATRKGGTTVNCSLQVTGWQCSEISILGEPLLLSAGPVVFPSVDDFKSSKIVETEARAVAGLQARCFDVTDFTGTARYCLSNEGVPLFYSTPSVTVEATAYTLEVPDSAFDLPIGN